jgi:hypothetical protein
MMAHTRSTLAGKPSSRDSNLIKRAHSMALYRKRQDMKNVGSRQACDSLEEGVDCSCADGNELIATTPEPTLLTLPIITPSKPIHDGIRRRDIAWLGLTAKNGASNKTRRLNTRTLDPSSENSMMLTLDPTRSSSPKGYKAPFLLKPRSIRHRQGHDHKSEERSFHYSFISLAGAGIHKGNVLGETESSSHTPHGLKHEAVFAGRLDYDSDEKALNMSSSLYITDREDTTRSSNLAKPHAVRFPCFYTDISHNNTTPSEIVGFLSSSTSSAFATKM